ncbi:MAG: hypothetical protein WBQ55_05950, partial [Xanthobacteraceae bacterium]
YFDAEHHVDVFGCPEWETSGIKQQVACRPADDGILILMPSEVLAKFFETHYHTNPSRSFSTAIETRSS